MQTNAFLPNIIELRSIIFAFYCISVRMTIVNPYEYGRMVFIDDSSAFNIIQNKTKAHEFVGLI